RASSAARSPESARSHSSKTRSATARCRRSRSSATLATARHTTSPSGTSSTRQTPAKTSRKRRMLPPEAGALAAHRLDRRRLADLPAELHHVHVDRARLDALDVAHAPHLGEERPTAHDPPLLAREESEHLDLAPRERDRAPVRPGAPRRRVDLPRA